MKPTIGRIVLYALSSQDVTLITARRAANVAVADRITDGWRINAKPEHSTPVELGEVFPAIVVRVDDESVNLKVMLDGADDLWVTERVESDTKFPGTWHWMDHQKQQHAKQEARDAENTLPTDAPDPQKAYDQAETALGLATGVAALPIVTGDVDGTATGIGTATSEPPAETQVDSSVLYHENGAPKFRTGDDGSIYHLDDQGNQFEPAITPEPSTGLPEDVQTVSGTQEPTPETETPVELADSAGNPLEVASEKTPEELEKLKEEVGF